eukprot:SAG11_NODE_1874_length_4143_cov_10.521761_3_plen_153_part_00
MDCKLKTAVSAIWAGERSIEKLCPGMAAAGSIVVRILLQLLNELSPSPGVVGARGLQSSTMTYEWGEAGPYATSCRKELRATYILPAGHSSFDKPPAAETSFSSREEGQFPDLGREQTPPRDHMRASPVFDIDSPQTPSPERMPSAKAAPDQ